MVYGLIKKMVIVFPVLRSSTVRRSGEKIACTLAAVHLYRPVDFGNQGGDQPCMTEAMF